MTTRILHLTSTPHWQLDGVVQRAARLAAHDMEVLHVDQHVSAVAHDPDASGNFAAAANDPSEAVLLERLMTLAKEFDPHVVHVQDPHDPALAQACRALANFPVARVLEVRRLDPLPAVATALLPAQVVVPAPEVRRMHESREGFAGAKVQLVADACSHPGRLQPQRVRAHTAIGHRPLVVCDGPSAFGDDRYVVRLAAALKARDPHVAVAVWVPESLRYPLRRDARNAGLADSDLILFSPEHGPELDDLLAAGDLALSHGGAHPWLGCVPFCLRAMAAGTPVVTELDSWVTDTIRASGAGIMLDDNITWAALELCRALRSPHQRTEGRRHARRLATHHAFDPVRADEALMDTYRAAAGVEKAA